MADSEDYVVGGTPDAHASSHESGGDDELDISGLTPADHASRHESGGADEIDVSGLVGAGGEIDRGDPASADFTVGDFTRDNAWHDLDLSSIVPADVVRVMLSIHIKTATVGSIVQWRKNGNSNTLNSSSIRALVANFTNSVELPVFCDSNRVVEYLASNVTWDVLLVTVISWRF